MTIILLLNLFFAAAQAKTEIIFWHSLAGHMGSELQKLTARFNQSQTDYRIKLIYKGDYVESLTSFAAAFRAKQPPALVQVFEVGTPTMIAPSGIIKPLDELMQEQNKALPVDSFFPAVRENYSLEGRLLAMPFNTSVPVIFYNAELLAKFGYSTGNFPQTWDALEQLAQKLQQAGLPCTYTSAYPAWVLIESFSALHGLPMVKTETHQAIYNNNSLVQHLTRLAHWQAKGYFQYGGRSDDATILFTSGQCPLLSQSIGAYISLKKLVPFSIGIAPLPLEQRISAERHNNVVGGAAIWAVSGQSPTVYQGISQFFAFLAMPAIQKDWYENTGYLPLGSAGPYEKIMDASSPILKLIQQELNARAADQKVVHLDAQNLIRAINEEALEAIFAGLKTPQKALDDAVKRANYVMLRFRQNTTVSMVVRANQ